MLVVTDAHSDDAVGIAGVKGGMPAGITKETTDIIIESANFDGPSVRKTSQALKLRTDASVRFEQGLSPELAGYCMRAVVNLIRDLAGGELQGFADAYPAPQEKRDIAVSRAQVQQVLGSTFDENTITDSFARLGFNFLAKDDAYIVAVPPLRLDLTIPEDLIEEIGRIQGYDRVVVQELPPFAAQPSINVHFYRDEMIREFLASRGFSEVYTSVFAERGERVVRNKVDGVRPYLRANLADGLQEALEKNVRNKELLGLPQVKLFEIGTVWRGGKEEREVAIAVEHLKKAQTQDAYQQELDAFINSLSEPSAYGAVPLSTATRYQPFSRYPYIVRDVAMWVPHTADEQELLKSIAADAGALCIVVMPFDRFEKSGRVSLAYRLIFQSFDRTLTDDDANAAMERVYARLQSQGFEIR
jgi:phenylalanyl-tRNA synthetase beta chain